MTHSPHNAKTIRLAMLVLMVLALIWSFNWILMKPVLRYVGTLDFTALRCVFGALVLLAMLPLTGRSLKPPPWRSVLWIGLLQTAGMRAFLWRRRAETVLMTGHGE